MRQRLGSPPFDGGPEVCIGPTATGNRWIRNVARDFLPTTGDTSGQRTCGVEEAVRFSDVLRRFPSLPGFVVAEGAAGSLLQVAVQAAILGKEGRTQLEDRFGTGLTPELLRSLHPAVE